MGSKQRPLHHDDLPLQRVVHPFALVRRAPARALHARPMPQPAAEAALEDVAVGVRELAGAVTVAVDELALVRLAVKLDHRAVAMRHAPLGRALGDHDAAHERAPVGVGELAVPHERIRDEPSFPHVAARVLEAADAVAIPRDPIALV